MISETAAPVSPTTVNDDEVALDSENVEASRRLSASSVPVTDEEDETRADLFSELVYTYGVRELVSSSGARVRIDTALGGKVVGLLFTSLESPNPECGMDSTFLATLVQLARKYESDISIVYVPCIPSATDDTAEMLNDREPWYAIPFENAETRESLREQFGASVSSFPVLCVLSPDGELLTTRGVNAVLYNTEFCVPEWKFGRSGVSWFRYIGVRFFGMK